MRKWKHAVAKAGIDLMDGGPDLLYLRFADDILIFASSRHELGQLIGSMMIHLEQVGLLLNAQKTVVRTNEAQPPPFLPADSSGMSVKSGWLTC